MPACRVQLCRLCVFQAHGHHLVLPSSAVFALLVTPAKATGRMFLVFARREHTAHLQTLLHAVYAPKERGLRIMAFKIFPSANRALRVAFAVQKV
jgi:hypothetical protein